MCMSRFIFGLLFGALLGMATLAGVVYLRDGNVQALRRVEVAGIDLAEVQRRTGDVVPMTRRALNNLLPEPPPREVTVVLNREGRRLYAGPDHARLGTSSVLLRNQVPALDLPGYRVSDRNWNRLGKCIESRFEGYRVNVVEDAPARGDYINVNFGGSPTMLNYQETTRGLAPYTGRLIPNAEVFVFTHGKPGLNELCETAAHEVGHALGLDHSRLCSDLMSYGDCGKKTFRDHEAACGEYEDRECQNGHDHQNSATRLERTVGRRSQSPASV